MRKIINIALSSSLLFLTNISVVQAISITFSGEPSKIVNGKETPVPALFLNFRGGGQIPYTPISIHGGIGIAPTLNGIVSPLPKGVTTDTTTLPGIGEVNLNQINLSRIDTLFDIDLNIQYNHSIIQIPLGVGNIEPIISPYLGYRGLYTYASNPTVKLPWAKGDTFSLKDSIFTNLQGINYGLRFTTLFPLGFSAHINAGATSLLGGGTSANTDPINTSKLPFLPQIGIGFDWDFTVASIYAGYSLFTLPKDIRLTNNLSGDMAWISSINIGLRFLFFSI